MVRYLIPPALAALVGTLLNAPPALAAQLPAPALAAELPAPALNLDPGQTVAQLEPLAVTDLDVNANSVRVAFGALPVEVWPVEEGAAAGVLETWGLAGGVPLVVAQCADNAGLDCGNAAQITVDVANPNPTFAPSRPGSVRTHDFEVAVGLTVASGTPRLAVGLDDDQPATVDPGHQLPVDVDALAEGAHEVRAAVCSADGVRCTAATVDSFEVVRTVSAGFSRSSAVFSPNGDGRAETLGFTYSLDDPWETGEIAVTDAAQNELRTIAVEPPAFPATQGTTTYDGKDGLGAFLPAGAYTATFTAARTLDGQEISSSYSQEFSVDVEALPATGLVASEPVVYPYKDAYKDRTTITWQDQESYAKVHLQIRDAANGPVRFMRNVASGVSWAGRDSDGTRVAPGEYHLRLRVEDQVGNRAWSASVPVTVSGKRLVTRVFSTKISPEDSRVSGGEIGSCSRWKVPSVHGWPGSASHLSNVRCDGGTSNRSVVWTIHRVELPAAVNYRQVQLSWYGGPTQSGTGHTALATVYDRQGAAVEWTQSLDYLTGQHADWAPAADVVRTGQRVKWAMSVNGGMRYDVKNFTIRVRADVLRSP